MFWKLLTAEFDRHVRRRSTWLFGLAAVVITLLICLDHHGDVSDRLASSGVLLMAWGYLSGAATVGQDISSGGLGTWLTFHPRRMRVWLARTVAISVTCVAVAATLLVLIWAAHLGRLGHHPRHDLAFVGMLVVFTVIAGLVGASMAALTGSFLGAIGAFIAYLALAFIQSVILNGTEMFGPLTPMFQMINDMTYTCFDCSWRSELRWFDPVDIVSLFWWTVAIVGVGTYSWYRRDVD